MTAIPGHGSNMSSDWPANIREDSELVRHVEEHPEDAALVRVLVQDVLGQLKRQESRLEEAAAMAKMAARRSRRLLRGIKELEGNQRDHRDRLRALEHDLKQVGQEQVQRVRQTGFVSVGATLGAAVAAYVSRMWLGM